MSQGHCCCEASSLRVGAVTAMPPRCSSGGSGGRHSSPDTGSEPGASDTMYWHEFFPVYRCVVWAASRLGKMGLLSILCETQPTDLVAHIMQMQQGHLCQNSPQGDGKPQGLTWAVGGTGYGAFGDGLYALSSYKGGSRGTLSSPSTPGHLFRAVCSS